MQVNGFYRVNFGALLPGAPGIVVLEDGRVRGGDGAYIYTGQYTESQGAIDATILVKPIEAGAKSVFGTTAQSFELRLAGAFSGAGFKLSGNAPIPGGPQIHISGALVSQING